VQSIYLDHAATTPMRPEVREAMAPFLSESFGNPSSTHSWGRRARSALDSARERAADALGVPPSEVYFLRGGTESINAAILGQFWAAHAPDRPVTLATTNIEHRAVLSSMDAAAAWGARLVRIGVRSDGSLDGAGLDEALDPGTRLISMMWVNNEVGMVLPVDEVARRARAAGVPFHTDAVQAVGHVRVRLDETPVDLASIAGHKICGPKGMGILYRRRGVDLAPLLYGAGQESGLRPGTEDVAGAVGMAKALALAVDEQEAEAPREARLRDLLMELLQQGIPGLRVLAWEAPRACHILTVAVPGFEGDALVAGLDQKGVAASAGSACDSGGTRRSHVLEELYGSDLDGLGTVRFSLGRETEEEEVRRAAGALKAVVRQSKTEPMAGL
jgi:cysteine desulfurase